MRPRPRPGAVARGSIAAVTKARLGLGCLGLVLRALAGALLGGFSAYALASALTKSRETQAYLTVLIVPSVALLGGLTLAATLALIPVKRGPLVPVAAVGWALVFGVLVMGVLWNHTSRPAQLRVQNETALPFRNLFVGGDFRRSTRLGELEPGATSRSVAVDLDEPGTFDALEGLAGSGYVRHRLTPAEASVVRGSELRWIVRGVDGALSYEFVPAP